jgi:hypothetical protein
MGEFYNYNKTDTDFTYKNNKPSEKKTNRQIYSTKIINQLIEDHMNGYEIPYDAFFQRDLRLRAPNIVFEMTPEEYEEYIRCYEDPLYYVSHYCKFQTDNDYQLVKLRPFQERVIKTVTDEHFIDASCEKIGPKNRNIIWMASRQSGKCGFYNSLISIIDKTDKSDLFRNNPKKIFIGDKYNEEKKDIIYKKISWKKKFISKLKIFLYRLYGKL